MTTITKHMQELLAAFIRYGRHDSNCAALTELLLCNPPKPAPCSCGFDQARAAISKGHPMTNTQTLLEALKGLVAVFDAEAQGVAQQVTKPERIADARAAVSVYESRSQSGVTESFIDLIVGRISNVKCHLSILEKQFACGGAISPEMTEWMLRQLRAGISEADGYIQETRTDLCRVSQPPADGRDDVIEECAKIADEHYAQVPYHNPDVMGYDLVAQGYGNAAHSIQTAIRALKSTPNTTDTVLAGAGGLK